MKASVSVVSRARRARMSAQLAPPCPGGWRCACLGTELGRRPGSEGTLLFGQQDPGGPSIAQVTMSIKHRTRPHKPRSDSLPDSSVRNQSGRRKPPVLGVLLFQCSEIYFPRITPYANKQYGEQHPHFSMPRDRDSSGRRKPSEPV